MADILDAIVQAIRKPDPNDFLSRFAAKVGITVPPDKLAEFRELERIAVHATAVIRRYDSEGEMAHWKELTQQFQAAIGRGETPPLLPSRKEHQDSYFVSCDASKEPERAAYMRLSEAVQPVRRQLSDALLAEADKIDAGHAAQSEDFGHNHQISPLVQRLRNEAAQLQLLVQGRSLRQLLPFLNL